MKVWADTHIDEFLHELLRKEGLGSHRQRPQCVTCKVALTATPALPNHDEADHSSSALSPLLRCRDCFGDCIECLACCLQRHARLPLHCTEVRVVPNILAYIR